MQTTNLKLFEINTTAWDEENFLLLTSLTEKQIIKVIKPIVKNERGNGVEYDNDMLVQAINTAYPNDVAVYYTTDGIDLISI